MVPHLRANAFPCVHAPSPTIGRSERVFPVRLAQTALHMPVPITSAEKEHRSSVSLCQGCQRAQKADYRPENTLFGPWRDSPKGTPMPSGQTIWLSAFARSFLRENHFFQFRGAVSDWKASGRFVIVLSYDGRVSSWRPFARKVILAPPCSWSRTQVQVELAIRIDGNSPGRGSRLTAFFPRSLVIELAALAA